MGVLASVQIFPFLPSGEPAQWGNYTSPPHCAAILQPLPGHSQNKLVLKTTLFTFHSVCSSLSSFHPSFSQHPCSACAGCRGHKLGWDLSPVFSEHQAWTYQRPSPSLHLRLRHRSGPQGSPLAHRPQVWAESQRGRHMGTPRENESQIGRMQRVIEGRKGEPEGYTGTDGQSCT